MNLKVRVQLSLMMFIQFFIWGCWLVPLWRYLTRIGFTGTETGAAYSTGSIAAIISPFFIGMVADRFFSAERVLGVMHLLGGAFMFWCSTIVSPGIFFWGLLLHTLCYMPTLALVNSISFDQMKDPGKEFPGIRVFGTIGWIAAGLIIGFMPQSVSGLPTIEDTSIPLKITAWASIVMGFYSFTLPHTPPKSAGKRTTIADVLGLKALKLLREVPFLVFVLASFLICIPLAFYYQSANGFLADSGISNSAAKMTLGQFSEIFFMLVMPFFFIRLGVKWMLAIGMLFWVARYILFAFGNGTDLAFMLYLGVLFHGICYDFFFVTGQIYVDYKAPKELRASAQGFIALVTYGVGMVIGNMVNGKVTDRYTSTAVDAAGETVRHFDWRAIWLLPAAMAAIVLVAFVFLFNDRIKTKNNHES